MDNGIRSCKELKLPWISQNVQNARTCQDMLLTWNRTRQRERVVLQSTKLKGVVNLKHSDIRHGDVDFGVCQAGFWSCFGSVFPHYDFFYHNVYPMMVEVNKLFDFI